MSIMSWVALAALAPQTNDIVSVASSGALANDASYFSQISDDGRYVAFQSEASNLTPGDFNGQYDIFRRDVQTGATELVSLRQNGAGSASSLGLAPAISGDGRFVAWQSNAGNIVAGDTNGTWDVFVRDMQLGVTERVSVKSNGAQTTLRSDEPEFSADGAFLFFESDDSLIPGDTNGTKDVYRLERATGQLELVSITQSGVQGNDWSYHASPSADGRYVAFSSSATNLVANDFNGVIDMFWKDMQTGELRRVNVTSIGGEANDTSTWPAISGDGMTVAFCSRASLVPGDTNGDWDLFAYDVPGQTLERLNVRPNGAQATSYVRSPVDLTHDGRFVIFASLSTTLIAGDTNGFQDIFLRDRDLDVTTRVSLDPAGNELDDDSFVPTMTPDGQFISYTSEASNVVAGDGNGERDIFWASFDGSIGETYCGPLNPNSTGATGTIAAFGSTVASANDLRLVASNLPTFQFGIFVCGRDRQYLVTPGAGGPICVGGLLGRFDAPGQILSTGTEGAFELQVDLTSMPQGSVVASAAAGETWTFQAWHRDFTVGPTSNLTNAVEIVWQ